MARPSAAGLGAHSRASYRKRRGRALKAMLDSNIFDLIADDDSGRLRSGLENDAGLALYVCEAQLAELCALPDASRAAELLTLVRALCRSVAPVAMPKASPKHARDALILATAAHSCDLLVTQDLGLREQARLRAFPALSFEEFSTLLRLG